MKVELKEGGAEVVLKKLSKSLDKDSVRVDGIGPASVTEVSFQVTNYYTQLNLACVYLQWVRRALKSMQSLYHAHGNSYRR